MKVRIPDCMVGRITADAQDHRPVAGDVDQSQDALEGAQMTRIQGKRPVLGGEPEIGLGDRNRNPAGHDRERRPRQLALIGGGRTGQTGDGDGRERENGDYSDYPQARRQSGPGRPGNGAAGRPEPTGPSLAVMARPHARHRRSPPALNRR